MPGIRQIILFNFAILATISMVACGVTPPAATPTPVNDIPAETAAPGTTPITPLTPAMAGTVTLPADLGGYKMTYQCFGEGSPTIVVEADAGDAPTTSLSWNSVIEKIQGSTRICIYDRAKGVPTSEAIAKNLHYLLNEIHVPGPYILIGHVLGGWHTRVFAHLYPDEVVGMVLVDSLQTSPEAKIALATVYPTPAPNEPEALTQNRPSEESLLGQGVAPTYEGLDITTSNEQVRQAGTLGDIPLVVISQNWQAEDLPGFDPVTQKELLSTTFKVSATLTTLSTNSSFVISSTSDHSIPKNDPQTIIDAINKILEEIKNKAK